MEFADLVSFHLFTSIGTVSNVFEGVRSVTAVLFLQNFFAARVLDEERER